MLDAGVKLLLLSGGYEEKVHAVVAMVSREIIIPQKTLADHYVRAKEKLDAKQNIDLDDLDAFDRKKMNAEGGGSKSTDIRRY